MKKYLIVIVAIVMASGAIYVLVPSDTDVAQQMDDAGAQAPQQASLDVVSMSDGVSVELSPTNTKIDFGCAKTVAGKTVMVHGGWSEQFSSTFTGTATIASRELELQRIEIAIEIASLWSEHDSLTEALVTRGFFQVEQHPQATFVSTAIVPEPPESTSMQDATHTIDGNLTLNGIERSIRFPAKVTFEGRQFHMNSEFSLNRREFDVVFSDSAGFGMLTDDDISDRVALRIEVGATISADPGQDSTVDATLPTPADTKTADAAEPTPSAELPLAYTETIPATQISFEMVLVPEDEQAGILPLYFGRHEVTWDEFMPWVNGSDLDSESQMGEQRALKLRPSPPYGAVDRNFGMNRRPVLGITRLAAEQYCSWLSEQTGKTYRLPTEAEWEHAYRAGGGDPESELTADDARRVAVYKDNSFDETVFGWATRPVGSTRPNDLGIFDLAGSVCEWVIGTGEEHVVRGGHYESPREELGVGRYVEDASWNQDDPSEPKSIWWYVNAPWAGLRVVCEAEAQ